MGKAMQQNSPFNTKLFKVKKIIQTFFIFQDASRLQYSVMKLVTYSTFFLINVNSDWFLIL